MSSLRLFCSRWKSFVFLALMSLYLYYFSSTFKNAWVIARTPVTWNHDSPEFLISKTRDSFDEIMRAVEMESNPEVFLDEKKIP